jgi:GH24 family phage-related lysozyme (muramidase)
VTACKEYQQLGANAKTTGLDSVANRKFKKDYADLSAKQQAIVADIVDKAVDNESGLLAYDVDQKLKADLQRFEAVVNANVTGVQLTLAEFDALVSFSFNIGIDGFKGSKLLKKINERKYRSGTVEQRKHAITEIEHAFNAWNKAGGKALSGLTKRRHDEAKAFLKEAREELEALKPKKHAAATVPHHHEKLPATSLHRTLP